MKIKRMVLNRRHVKNKAGQKNLIQLPHYNRNPRSGDTEISGKICFAPAVFFNQFLVLDNDLVAVHVLTYLFYLPADYYKNSHKYAASGIWSSQISYPQLSVYYRHTECALTG